MCIRDSSCSVENCFSTGNISLGSGGIVGSMATNTTIINCYSTGDILSESGGICGKSSGDNTSVSLCYSTGNISGGSGGIFGNNLGDVSALSCYTSGTVQNDNYSGGIYGSTLGNTGYINVTSCFTKDGVSNLDNDPWIITNIDDIDGNGTIMKVEHLVPYAGEPGEDGNPIHPLFVDIGTSYPVLGAMDGTAMLQIITDTTQRVDKDLITDNNVDVNVAVINMESVIKNVEDHWLSNKELGQKQLSVILEYEAILGCMDQDMYSFDKDANIHNEEDCVQFIFGCTDDTKYNYKPDANTDDGTCIPILFGCIDQDAFNYNSSANTDDGSCEDKVIGCTDISAYN